MPTFAIDLSVSGDCSNSEKYNENRCLSWSWGTPALRDHVWLRGGILRDLALKNKEKSALV
jgi:hypothetical protein